MAQYGVCTNDYTTDFVKPVAFAFCVSGNALGRGEGFLGRQNAIERVLAVYLPHIVTCVRGLNLFECSP